MRAIDADELKKCVLKWLPQDQCGQEEKEMPLETDICVSMLMEIDEQPTIQPEPHWIPVTKDTPKEAGTYMCTCYDADRRIVTLVKWQPRTKTWNLIGARAYWKVIAWCKRPEPYKGVNT